MVIALIFIGISYVITSLIMQQLDTEIEILPAESVSIHIPEKGKPPKRYYTEITILILSVTILHALVSDTIFTLQTNGAKWLFFSIIAIIDAILFLPHLNYLQRFNTINEAAPKSIIITPIIVTTTVSATIFGFIEQFANLEAFYSIDLNKYIFNAMQILFVTITVVFGSIILLKTQFSSKVDGEVNVSDTQPHLSGIEPATYYWGIIIASIISTQSMFYIGYPFDHIIFSFICTVGVMIPLYYQHRRWIDNANRGEPKTTQIYIKPLFLTTILIGLVFSSYYAKDFSGYFGPMESFISLFFEMVVFYGIGILLIILLINIFTSQSKSRSSTSLRKPVTYVSKIAEKPVTTSTLNCRNCNAVLDPNTKFCINCGNPVATKKICPNCSFESSPDAKFCEGCGKALEEIQPASSQVDTGLASATQSTSSQVTPSAANTGKSIYSMNRSSGKINNQLVTEPIDLESFNSSDPQEVKIIKNALKYSQVSAQEIGKQENMTLPQVRQQFEKLANEHSEFMLSFEMDDIHLIYRGAPIREVIQ